MYACIYIWDNLFLYVRRRVWYAERTASLLQRNGCQGPSRDGRRGRRKVGFHDDMHAASLLLSLFAT